MRRQIRIVGLGNYNDYYSYFLYGIMEGAIRCGTWFRSVPITESLRNIEDQIDFFKPHILLCHMIFGQKFHPYEPLWEILKRTKKKNDTCIFYHAGDARFNPRIMEPINSFVDYGLCNHGMSEKYSSIWKIPCFHWPYAALYQQGILETAPDMYKCDVSFAGSLSTASGHVHSDRAKFIEKLKAKGINVKIFPTPETGNTRFQTAELAAGSKMVLGSQITKRGNDEIPLYQDVRPFQYIGAGGFYAHDEHPYMEQFFKAGEHYVGYSSADDLAKKYKYYVYENPQEGMNIRKNGFEFAQRHHSTKERMQAVINIYWERDPKLPIYLKNIKEETNEKK